MIITQPQSLVLPRQNALITSSDTVARYSNEDVPEILKLYKSLEYYYGCTYLIYFYEDLALKSKVVYSSNWLWQNELIGQKLINDCAIFKIAYKALEPKESTSFLIPWNYVEHKTSKEKDILLYRSEFDIANGIGLTLKSGEKREGLAFGGAVKDKLFHQRIVENKLIYKVLMEMRIHLLSKPSNYLQWIHYHLGNSTIH